jgi:hypothetical protein
MLLSHNFNISPEIVPALSREEFAKVFESGMSQTTCRLINHPHWIVEILFAIAEFSPAEIGQLCATALATKRQQTGVVPQILILGGLKTTPPTSDAPEALQTGEWGVDVVETESSATFLQGLNWDAAIAQKPADTIFKIECN